MVDIRHVVIPKVLSKKKHIGIIISSFHEDISDNLLQGCLKALSENAITKESIHVYRVPGAFEIPFLAKKIIQAKKHQAVIVLGAVIQGKTDHYKYVCKGLVEGLMNLNLSGKIPVIFEVLMVKYKKLALERASKSNMSKNKGYSAGMTALYMIELINSKHLK